jgi:hypothetical protein
VNEKSYVNELLAGKCQDIDNPILMLKNAKTSITRKIFSLLARHEQKIIMCENGPFIKLVGAHDDFSAAHQHRFNKQRKQK